MRFLGFRLEERRQGLVEVRVGLVLVVCPDVGSFIGVYRIAVYVGQLVELTGLARLPGDLEPTRTVDPRSVGVVVALIRSVLRTVRIARPAVRREVLAERVVTLRTAAVS